MEFMCHTCVFHVIHLRIPNSVALSVSELLLQWITTHTSFEITSCHLMRQQEYFYSRENRDQQIFCQSVKYVCCDHKNMMIKLRLINFLRQVQDLYFFCSLENYDRKHNITGVRQIGRWYIKTGPEFPIYYLIRADKFDPSRAVYI